MNTWVWIGWFFEDEAGQRVGPLTGEEIKSLLQSGRLRPWSVVYKVWKDGEAVHEFKSEAQVAVAGRTSRL